MQQPLFTLLKSIPQPVFSGLVERWHAIQAPWLQRVVMIVAASRQPDSAGTLLPAAAASPDLVLRAGACEAANRDTIALPTSDDLVDRANGQLDLAKMLGDPRWEVRAQAAKALGRLGLTDAAQPLGEALRDSSFWVRQNAAAALVSLGEVGQQVLENVVAAHDDRFAVDAACQHLQAQRLLAESQSGRRLGNGRVHA
jgi:HEAT repeat protein